MLGCELKLYAESMPFHTISIYISDFKKQPIIMLEDQIVQFAEAHPGRRFKTPKELATAFIHSLSGPEIKDLNTTTRPAPASPMVICPSDSPLLSPVSMSVSPTVSRSCASQFLNATPTSRAALLDRVIGQPDLLTGGEWDDTVELVTVALGDDACLSQAVTICHALLRHSPAERQVQLARPVLASFVEHVGTLHHVERAALVVSTLSVLTSTVLLSTVAIDRLLSEVLLLTQYETWEIFAADAPAALPDFLLSLPGPMKTLFVEAIAGQVRDALPYYVQTPSGAALVAFLLGFRCGLTSDDVAPSWSTVLKSPAAVSTAVAQAKWSHTMRVALARLDPLPSGRAVLRSLVVGPRHRKVPTRARRPPATIAACPARHRLDEGYTATLIAALDSPTRSAARHALLLQVATDPDRVTPRLTLDAALDLMDGLIAFPMAAIRVDAHLHAAFNIDEVEADPRYTPPHPTPGGGGVDLMGGATIEDIAGRVKDDRLVVMWSNLGFYVADIAFILGKTGFAAFGVDLGKIRESMEDRLDLVADLFIKLSDGLTDVYLDAVTDFHTFDLSGFDVLARLSEAGPLRGHPLTDE